MRWCSTRHRDLAKRPGKDSSIMVHTSHQCSSRLDLRSVWEASFDHAGQPVSLAAGTSRMRVLWAFQRWGDTRD